MSISGEILQNLLCSNCKKYLSIPPIKVYPSKQVKCGRCCVEDDGGTISKLYELVTKDLKFPCINHMEGCTKELLISEMSRHEGICLGRKYCCPVCPYADYSFNMHLHIINHHDSVLVQNKEFYIDLERENQDSVFFYFDRGLLLYLTATYEVAYQQLAFSINLARQDEQQNMVSKFFMYSIENRFLFKTQSIPCPTWGPFREIFKVKLLINDYPRKIAVCKFEINKEPVLHLLDTIPPTMDSSVSTALLKYTFNGISEMALNTYVYATVPSYGVMNLSWKVLISKVVEEEDQHFLSVYLEKEKDTPDCYITAKFTLLNVREKYNIVRSFKRRSIKHGLGFNRFLKFEGIVNPKYGFIENDSIRIDAQLKVEEMEGDDEKEECTSCKRKCTLEDSVNVSTKSMRRE